MKSRSYMLITGILFVLAGVMCFAFPASVLLNIVWLIGLLVMLSGVSGFLSWTKLHFIMPRSGSLLFSSILQFVIGLAMMNHNFMTAVYMVYVIAALLFIEGVNVLSSSFAYKRSGYRNWWIIFLLGALLFGAGIYSFIRPFNSGQMVSIFLGVIFVLIGCFYFLSLGGITYVKRSFDRLR